MWVLETLYVQMMEYHLAMKGNSISTPGMLR